MTKETRTNRQVFDVAGTLSTPGGLKFDVQFDLIEFEDLIDGLPGTKLSYGNLRFSDTLPTTAVPLLLSSSRLILTGGGIHATVCLYRLTSFTVLTTISTVCTITETPAHVDLVAAQVAA